jgi:N-methylhydantoinase A
MRFVGQGYEINVPLPDGGYGRADMTRLRDAFFAGYAATYGDRAFDRNDAVEFVHFRIAASVSLEPLVLPKLELGDGTPTRASKGRRQVYFPETSGFCDCPVYDRYALRAGDAIVGPAIVEERESTVVVPPESRAEVDDHGNIILDLAASAP